MSRRENVFSGVGVPVVCRATFAANPFPYSQTRSTFRTAGGNALAARTSLGCVAFIDYLEDDTGLMALVFQHRPEHGPARVQRAFGHLGFDQLGAGHVAHKNGGVVFHQAAAQLTDLDEACRAFGASKLIAASAGIYWASSRFDYIF